MSSMLKDLSKEDLEQRLEGLKDSYASFKERELSLDITRGKPSADALDLSNDLLTCLASDEFISEEGVDCRNYGGLDGLIEAKNLFSQVLKSKPEEIIIGGNSSLTLMHDLIARANSHGFPESSAPLATQKVKAICPVPGYDRHFSICSHFGIEMVTVGMDQDGPDVEAIEKLVAEDDSIKLLWIVPKYSNPTGSYFSDERLQRLAKMKTKATDFKIVCDDAYAVHHWSSNPQPEQISLLQACQDAGNPERVFVFGSTSKVTLAGSGLSFLAASKGNADWVRSHLFVQTIGPDKINQLRHVRFLKDIEGIREHMSKHAELILPKFEMVCEAFEKNLSGKGIAEWTNPEGGYFISLDVLAGCASKVFKLASESGLKLTPAGATFPYKKDPADTNIRIAPTVPTLDSLKTAMELLCVCIELASIEKLIEQSS